MPTDSLSDTVPIEDDLPVTMIDTDILESSKVRLLYYQRALVQVVEGNEPLKKEQYLPL